MRSDRRTSRVPSTNGLATTASALVALVAIAAMAAGPGGRTIATEARIAQGEAQTVRQVAAAVVAAARELVGKERVVAALPMPAALFTQVRSSTLAAIQPQRDPIARVPLAERLLDLPPPQC
jgi:hypothetical protein